MTVTDAFAYAIAGLLIIQAVLRAKSVLNGLRRKRSLWGAFAALAVSWLCRTSTVNDLLDATGILDLGFLVKHVTAIVGICVLLRYVTAVYADADADVRRSARISAVVHRIAARASVGTIAVMAATFFFLLDPPDTSTLFFLERHEETWACRSTWACSTSTWVRPPRSVLSSGAAQPARLRFGRSVSGCSSCLVRCSWPCCTC